MWPPVDLLIDGADPIIGDRSFGTTPAEVSTCDGIY